MATPAVGQAWTMIARAVSSRLVSFRIVSIAVRGFAREAACVDERGRAFTIPVANLRRGVRGAKCVTNPDGTPYVPPPRVRRRPGKAAIVPGDV
jgi:hypothetical protein